jgi:hypothetical protein
VASRTPVAAVKLAGGRRGGCGVAGDGLGAVGEQAGGGVPDGGQARGGQAAGEAARRPGQGTGGRGVGQPAPGEGPGLGRGDAVLREGTRALMTLRPGRCPCQQEMQRPQEFERM